MSNVSALLRASGGQLYGSAKWREEVSRLLDVAASKLLVTMGQIRIGSGGTAPIVVEAGPTLGWLMAVGNFLYTELHLDPNVDRTQSLVVGLAWAPAGSEAGKTVRWVADIGLEYEGGNIADIDLSKGTTASVPATAAVYAETAFVLSPAEWAANPEVDELHVRFTREATASDPALPPGIHHVVLVQVLAL